MENIYEVKYEVKYFHEVRFWIDAYQSGWLTSTVIMMIVFIILWWKAWIHLRSKQFSCRNILMRCLAARFDWLESDESSLLYFVGLLNIISSIKFCWVGNFQDENHFRRIFKNPKFDSKPFGFIAPNDSREVWFFRVRMHLAQNSFVSPWTWNPLGCNTTLAIIMLPDPVEIWKVEIGTPEQ